MGVIPLQFPDGQDRRDARPDRRGDLLDLRDHRAQRRHHAQDRTVKVTAGDVEFDAVVRIDTPGEANYYRNGGIMQYVLRNLLKA